MCGYVVQMLYRYFSVYENKWYCVFVLLFSFIRLFSLLVSSPLFVSIPYLLPLPPDHPCDVTVVDTRVDDALHERACETTTLGGKSGKKNVSEPVHYESPALTC